MKNIKKIFSLMLVAIFAIMSVIAPVSAEVVSGTKSDTDATPATGSITISNAVAGEEYRIYQILKAESYSVTVSGTETNNTGVDASATGNKVAYFTTTDSKWNAFLDGYQVGTTTTTNVFTAKNVKLSDGTTRRYYVYNGGLEAAKDIKDFADAALAYAEKTGTYAQREGAVITPTDEDTAGADGVQFTGLSLGYYLIKSSVGSVLQLNHNFKDLVVTEKNNTTPSTDKKVVEGSVVKSETDKFVGDEITFEVKLSNVAGMKNVKLVDTMSKGLTFKAGSAYYTIGATFDEENKVNIVPTSVNGEDGAKIWTFDFTNIAKGIDIDATATDIVVRYVATVNASAQTNIANTNDAYVKYGNNSDTSITPSKVKVYTHEFTITKVDEKDTNLTAKFVLKKGTTTLCFTKEGSKYTHVGETTDNTCTTGSTEVIASSTATFYGLQAGTYTLEETEAPEGYNILGAGITVKIEADENDSSKFVVKYNGETAIDGSFKVVNTKGTVLPSTGGMGTVLFVTVGSIMVMAAGIVLITKFRMAKEA